MNSVPVNDKKIDSEKSSKTSTLSRRLFVFHAWLGFKLSIVMFVICVSGSIATISHEIDWLINPMLRVEATNKPVQWNAMQRNFAKTYPQAKLSFVQAPLYANFASIGLMYTSDNKLRRVFFDPYTGEVIGDISWQASVQRVTRDLHRFLLFPNNKALYFVTFFGFVLTISAISGLLIYKKWWKGFFKLRIGRGRRVFYGDLHRLLGVWSVWFLLAIGITGVWYFVERAMSDVGVSVYSRIPTVENPDAKNNVISLADALVTVRNIFPDLKIDIISMADSSGNTVQPYIISGQRDAILVRARSNQIVVNPFDGGAMSVSRTEDANILTRWSDTADPLHFGNFAGLWVKLLWFVLGIFIAGMTLTGSWMWLRRSQLPENHVHVATPMGWWKPFSIGLLALGLCLGAYAISISI
ncbi:PepSY-associated TM helix domain-containing protein [Aurantivibrio infirmus]